MTDKDRRVSAGEEKFLFLEAGDVPRRDCLSGKIHDRMSRRNLDESSREPRTSRVMRFRTYSERGIKTEKSVCHL